MFNKTYVSAVTQRVTENVHVHRAPTDASVQLLNEMQEKIEANTLLRRDLVNNSFQGVVEIFYDVVAGQSFAKIVCCLNSANIEFKTAIGATPFAIRTSSDAARELFDSICKELTAQLLTRTEILRDLEMIIGRPR